MSDTTAATELQHQWMERVLGIQARPATPSPPEKPLSPAQPLSLVKLGAARIEWLRARQAAIAGIARLRTAIAAEFETDPEQANALATALAMLDTLVARLDEQLETDLDALLNAAPGPAQAAASAKARQGLRAALALVDTDPLLAEIDGNEVLPDLEVQAPLRARLADIAAALA